MKPTTTQKKRVENWIEKWRPRLYLQEWYFNIEYMSGSLDSDDYIINATIMACPTYLKAKIRIYPDFWSIDKDRQERIIVHELSHCLTQELWNVTDDLHMGKLVSQDTIKQIAERLTQRISTAVFMGYE